MHIVMNIQSVWVWAASIKVHMYLTAILNRNVLGFLKNLHFCSIMK